MINKRFSLELYQARIKKMRTQGFSDGQVRSHLNLTQGELISLSGPKPLTPVNAMRQGFARAHKAAGLPYASSGPQRVRTLDDGSEAPAEPYVQTPNANIVAAEQAFGSYRDIADPKMKDRTCSDVPVDWPGNRVSEDPRSATQNRNKQAMGTFLAGGQSIGDGMKAILGLANDGKTSVKVAKALEKSMRKPEDLKKVKAWCDVIVDGLPKFNSLSAAQEFVSRTLDRAPLEVSSTVAKTLSLVGFQNLIPDSHAYLFEHSYVS